MNGTAASRTTSTAPWSCLRLPPRASRSRSSSAPGRFLAGPLAGRLDARARAFRDRVVAPGYIWMSGHVLLRPVVSGVAAQLLARHPVWTPGSGQGRAHAHRPRASRRRSASRPASARSTRRPRPRSTSPPNPNENLYALRRAPTDDRRRRALRRRPRGAAHVARTRAGRARPGPRPRWTSATLDIRAPGPRPPGRPPPGRALRSVDASWTSASWTSASWTSASGRPRLDVRQLDELTHDAEGRRNAAPPGHGRGKSDRAAADDADEGAAHSFVEYRAQVQQPMSVPAAADGQARSPAGSPAGAAAWAYSWLVIPASPPSRRSSRSPPPRSRPARMASVRAARPARRRRAAALGPHRPQPQLRHIGRGLHRRRRARPAALALVVAARDRPAPARVGEGALPLVHPGLQHRELRRSARSPPGSVAHVDRDAARDLGSALAGIAAAAVFVAPQPRPARGDAPARARATPSARASSSRRSALGTALVARRPRRRGRRLRRRRTPGCVPAARRAARWSPPLVLDRRAPARERGALPGDVRVRRDGDAAHRRSTARILTANRAAEEILGYDLATSCRHSTPPP